MSNTQMKQSSQTNEEESSVEVAPSAMTTKEATHPTMTVGWVASLVDIADKMAAIVKS